MKYVGPKVLGKKIMYVIVTSFVPVYTFDLSHLRRNPLVPCLHCLQRLNSLHPPSAFSHPAETPNFPSSVIQNLNFLTGSADTCSKYGTIASIITSEAKVSPITIHGFIMPAVYSNILVKDSSLFIPYIIRK